VPFLWNQLEEVDPQAKKKNPQSHQTKKQRHLCVPKPKKKNPTKTNNKQQQKKMGGVGGGGVGGSLQKTIWFFFFFKTKTKKKNPQKKIDFLVCTKLSLSVQD